MKSITSSWKECVIQYDKSLDNGSEKKVSEKYVVDALSFGEAEKRIIAEMERYVSGEFDVLNITPCVFKEIFFDEGNDAADKWYKAKLAFFVLDEKSGKEKKTRVHYLVQASSFDGAKKAIESVMGDTMLDYVIEEVKETLYFDVYVHGEEA